MLINPTTLWVNADEDGNPWPPDDTRWAPSAVTSTSFLLITDPTANLIYKVTANSGFTGGNAYSAGQNSVLQLNPATGALIPIFVSISAPKGIAFTIP
ncbi:MAG: hypothetical protein ACYCSS_02670 [Sulfuriferula sp.]